MSELIFTGINIRAFVNEILNQAKDAITSGMNESELKAFDFGVETVVSQLEQYSDKEENLVVIAGDNPSEEFTLDDLSDVKGFDYVVEEETKQIFVC